jgi:hypothetical protein
VVLTVRHGIEQDSVPTRYREVVLTVCHGIECC